MKLKYIAAAIIVSLLILLPAGLACAAGKGWYWFMKMDGKKTPDKTADTSDKKDVNTADATADTDKDKAADTKDAVTVPQPQVQEDIEGDPK